MPDSVVINGVEFRKNPECKYWGRYLDVEAQIQKAKADGLPFPEIQVYRSYIRDDLWFIVAFVLKVPLSVCNNPFWVTACKEVQKGPASHTLDLWAREHGKSTIITVARTIQKLVMNADERVCIFSHTKHNALSFFRSIKYTFEQSDFLKACFPDVLYQDPTTEAWKWSESDGLYLRRASHSKEPSLMAASLIEGMPTGFHFSGRVYDDVETPDGVFTPEISQKLKDSFDMSQNLGTLDGWHWVIGTPYHHEGLLMYIKGKKDVDGRSIYTTRLKPATVDGTPNGKSAYLPESRLAELRTNKRMFFSQQLLDPTPMGTQALDHRNLKEVFSQDIPERLFKFMVVDPAGERKDRVGDAWAIWVIGVDPYMDDLGASNVYLLDGCVDVLTETEAMETVCQMYIRNGQILQLGVEKVGMSTFETHVSNYLRAKGRYVTVDSGNLVLLRPAGRSKIQRIESSLSWPLNNGKIHMSAAIPIGYRERLKLEMQKFPYWHDDGLDALSYLYDVLREYKFGKRLPELHGQPFKSKYGRRRINKNNGWMIV